MTSTYEDGLHQHLGSIQSPAALDSWMASAFSHKRVKMTGPWLNIKTLVLVFLSLSGLVVYNEFLVYYIVLLQCTWPQIHSSGHLQSSLEPLKAMLIADTHLLGLKEGHWLDKLRREWQMERTFQTAMSVHSPDIVFILGDLFDEGKWCSDAEFHYYVARFHKMFRVSEDTDVKVVVGNHDIGFHYMVDENKRRRFTSAFTAPSVNMMHKRDVTFVLLNSMAFEGDNCEMCLEAEQMLSKVTHSLHCAQDSFTTPDCKKENFFQYTRPIVLQHFPLYRRSDSNCSGADAAPPKERDALMKPKWDCLSKVASQTILSQLNPRLIISGHTHHFCHTMHPGDIPEWTIPSFSWRNKKTPSFLLLSATRDAHEVHKCFMPQEMTVIYTYIIGIILILLIFLFPTRLIFNSRSVKRH